MKFRYIFILAIFVIAVLPYSCKQQKKKSAVTEEEMITAKTLGLAYLEENKPEEAEAEFLKLVEYNPDEALGYANLGLVYLRMGKYEEAENWLKRAIEIDPEDPDVRLILAKVYEMDDEAEKAIEELEKIIQFAPGHIKSLYNLTELYSASKEKNYVEKRHKYTKEMVEKAPGNIVPRLNLTDILIKEGLADKALEQIEKLNELFPEFPKEAIEYYDQTIDALQAGDPEKAAVSFMVFHNYLKVTTPYQAGILDLKGPGGSLIGSPVVTFDQQKSGAEVYDWKALLEAINFSEITSSAGLDFLRTEGGKEDVVEKNPTHITSCDFDGDGDIDLYAGHFDFQSQSYKHYLLRNEWGKFEECSEEAGINHEGVELSARFVDYNNDGFFDLYIIRKGANILYENKGNGTFEDVSEDAGVADESIGNSSLFFDYDHDGDLDLFLMRPMSNMLYRNNTDGTFSDQTEKSNTSGGDIVSSDGVFGDFDEDGDIDLFVANEDASNILYSNQRQGVFKDVTEEKGLKSEKGSSAVTIGDYNNDGFSDLFVASLKAGNCKLYINQGDGSFEIDDRSEDLNQTLEDVRVYDASFLDFDNDGFLDLLVVGESIEKDSSGVFLYHNDGTGKLWVVSGILPEDLKSGKDILTFDYNDDGDMDVVVTDINGSIRLLRNDGGNNNHFVKMKLVGLRTGSGKNNYYGIGAKVEVRAGNLYQSQVVTEPNIYFGLGPREKADVIRILWTNGVPQNMFFPKTDQDLVEEQMLKGSCPFLYTWNGKEYVFLKDIMWRSALGMPLGIMGEDQVTKYASSAPSVDYIKIPAEFLKEKNGKYSVQVTDELWETIYFDKVRLITLDHPDSIDLFVDERFTPPAKPGYKLYQVNEKRIPVSATTGDGVDLLPYISEKDDKYVSNFKQEKYQGVTEMTDLIMNFGKIDPSKDLVLYLNGWIFPTDASINASLSQSDGIKIVSPYIQAINEKGEWETIVDNISFPMGKDKTIVVDLSGKLNASDPRIKIRTNMEIYWDHIFFANENTAAPVRSKILDPVSADLHYRGFSRTYRKGGRYGPHWFDYSEVDTDQKWRDLTGTYTRFGDVLPLLDEADDKYIIQNAGDEITIEFSAESLPELQEGWKRDFLIHSVGWVKDGDLNTAEGQFVEPLPFHGMSCYPYGPDESYPSGPEHMEYMKKYNTRKVDTHDRAFLLPETCQKERINR